MIVVNGRFLAATPTGLHGTARALVAGLRERGRALELVAPPSVDDPMTDRVVPGPHRGRLGPHLWEQFSLPRHAGDRVVLSLTNTGPVLARRGAVMVHDLAALAGPEWFARSMGIYVRVTLAAARRAERVLTVSQVVASELAHHGVAHDLIRVVPPAVGEGFHPSTAEEVAAVRARHGLDDQPYVLFVGWADPRKQAELAARAHLAAARDIAHRLVLVGRPHPTFAPVQLPSAPSIVRLPWVPFEDLVALLTGASGLVYPSLYEGFGLPPLEAWACGTPALLADVPVLRESSEGRGTYLPPTDPDAWAEGIRALVGGRVAVPAPRTRTWADAAAQLDGVLDEL